MVHSYMLGLERSLIIHVDTILPTGIGNTPHRADNPRPKMGVISKQSTSLLEVPFLLEPFFIAQENWYRHARQDYDHIGLSVNLCMQSNFDA